MVSRTHSSSILRYAALNETWYAVKWKSYMQVVCTDTLILLAHYMAYTISFWFFLLWEFLVALPFSFISWYLLFLLAEACFFYFIPSMCLNPSATFHFFIHFHFIPKFNRQSFVYLARNYLLVSLWNKTFSWFIEGWHVLPISKS